MRKISVILLAIHITVCLNVSAQKRGMADPEAVFIEKGTLSAGLSFGYDSWRADGDKGYDLLGLLHGLDGYVRQGDVSASGAWFFRDNVSVGLRLGYSDTRISMDSVRLVEIEIPDRHISRQALNGALTMRCYLPLFDGRIVAMFFEGRLSGSAGYFKNYRLTDNGKEGDYCDQWKASVGVYPGISVFATQDISFELSLPLFEGGLRRQIQDGTETDGTLTRSFINFRPGLTGISMGLVYHF